YGTFAWTTPPQPREVRSLPAATAAAGFDVLAPSSLPQGVTGTARYGVINRSTATFTFSAEAARASAAKAGRTIPPLPKDVDGAKLTITAGPAAIQVWGATDPTATTTGPTGSAGGTLGGIPTLVIGQAKAPTVTSDGVTVDELRGYLLQQPGISPQLAAALRAITDPSSTLPAPVPAALAGLTMSVRVGQVYGFLGPNGAGKTTAVKLLLGLATRTSGTGAVLGEPLGSRGARRRIGYLPELFRYQPWLGAREVLALHCE